MLDLKARYRVANVMTTTYVEVSNRYIMPGVARIDRLSLLKPETMSKEVRVQQVREIDQLAREGQKDISRHVNAVSFPSPISFALRSFCFPIQAYYFTISVLKLMVLH